jgi:uncharacterized membrane protein YkvA (DUF1232 family)
MQSYRRYFSESVLWNVLKKRARQIGIQVVYAVMLLYYAFRKPGTPFWAKNVILGALGYFLAPFDAIPDLSPLIGYTDDLGVMLFALVTVSMYIDEGIREQARTKLQSWFGPFDPSALDEVEKRL